MRNIISMLVAILIGGSCVGQTVGELQKNADSLYKRQEYRAAAVAYSSASRLMDRDQSWPLFRLQMLAARSWSLSKIPDSAFMMLDSLSNSRSLVYNSLVTLINEKDLDPLRADLRWEKLTARIFEMVTKETRVPLNSSYTQEEIIYGRKDGMALTMLHLKPKSGLINRAIILLRSGGWGSNYYMSNTAEALPYLQNGYNVFIVFHGSEPVYSIVDAIQDIQRAVRFIRFNAANFAVDPGKLGILGISAGGHLALMSGLADSSFVINSPDPLDKVSSKVQAVVSFYPATDFLYWNARGQDASSAELFKSLNHLLEFRNWNAQRRQFNYVTDSTKWRSILKQISPVNHLSSNDAPVLIFHGDNDGIVPFRQTELFVKEMQAANIPVSFIMKKGEGHGWPRTEEEQRMILDWFAKHLK